MFDLPSLINRREFVRLMSAAVALASSGCARRPLEPIVPYATAPTAVTAGEPTYFATALTRGGYAHGVLVECNGGRPTKIEGNPAHPASLGATDAIEQGRILELWDPERSRAIRRGDDAATWNELRAMLIGKARRFAADGGAGLRVLTRATSSFTLERQLAALRRRYPNLRWHAHEAVSRTNVYAGTRAAFGRALEPLYRFDRAQVVVALDADFLGTLPGHVRYARDFRRNRVPETGAMSRLYSAECMPTITGATADRRIALRASEIGDCAGRLAQRLTHGGAVDDAWLAAAAADLHAHRGESLVVVGDAQPAAVHALAYRLNALLGNLGRTLDFIAPPIVDHGADGGSLDALVRDASAGRVDTLVILDANPVYDAPADLEFAAALARVPTSIHCGLHYDETARRCTWHVPQAHELETWSDARAFDGTATIQQPLIAPLYGGRSLHELIAMLDGAGRRQQSRAGADDVAGAVRRRPLRIALGSGAAQRRRRRHGPSDRVRRGTRGHACEAAPRISRWHRAEHVRHRRRGRISAGCDRLGRPLREHRVAAGIAQADHAAHAGTTPRSSHPNSQMRSASPTKIWSSWSLRGVR